jgi:hypothetical protein
MIILLLAALGILFTAGVITLIVVLIVRACRSKDAAVPPPAPQERME